MKKCLLLNETPQKKASSEEKQLWMLPIGSLYGFSIIKGQYKKYRSVSVSCIKLVQNVLRASQSIFFNVDRYNLDPKNRSQRRLRGSCTKTITKSEVRVPATTSTSSLTTCSEKMLGLQENLTADWLIQGRVRHLRVLWKCKIDFHSKNYFWELNVRLQFLWQF